ncbi:MFS transporter [Nocardioides sp. Iso805N]|uniref:MFS transporter n=1 Tax=Nocardioides sp. Iso805N TaxID=1283287 RepID=UPI00037CBA30|nr:MFS transporter [Nocardioides sp. Iso805N]
MPGFRERILVPVLIFVGGVVSVVSSLGAPLIPRLAERLHTSIGNAQWALTATVLVAAVSSPLVGRLGDGRHRKRVMLVCLAVVVAGGALAAVATTLALLILGRAFQGLGLAIMPLAMAAARDNLPAERAGRAIAALSVVAAAGVGLGYPVTGLLADHGGVELAYWVGAGVSALALVLAWLVVPAPRNTGETGPIDLPGAVIVGAGLVSLLVALDKAADWGWGSTRVILMIVIGLALLGLWALYELRVAHPLVDLRLVRRRPVLTANVSGLLLGVVMYVSMVGITEFVQLPGFGLGESIFVAGLTLVPLSVLSASVSRTLPWVTARVGLRLVIPFGSLMVSAASVFFAFGHSHLWQIFVSAGLLGIGLGYTFAAMPGLIVGSVPSEETSSAMGFYQVSRYVGFAIGSGLAVTLLRAFGDQGAPTLGSYQATALVAAGLGVVTALVAWLLPGRQPVVQASPDLEAFEMEEGMLAAAGLEDLESPVGRARH